MTARLSRLLKSLDDAEKRMSRTPAVRRYGRLTRATGLILEATGLQMPLGSTCLIERHDGKVVQEVESEVVGFNGQNLFLMPLEEVEGILPGARVYARISPDGHMAGKQLPLGPQLLGRVLDGSAKPLDGLPPPDTGYRAALITPPFNPLQRTPITDVLDVGVRAINALLTVGRGQRMGLFAGSGKNAWLTPTTATASNRPLTNAPITAIARSNSANPAAEIMVMPITRKVTINGLPPCKPKRNTRNRPRPINNTPLTG